MITFTEPVLRKPKLNIAPVPRTGMNINSTECRAHSPNGPRTGWEPVPTFLIYGELKFAATYLINKGSALLLAMTEGVVFLNADAMHHAAGFFFEIAKMPSRNSLIS